MVSFLFVSTLLERKALKLSKWACTRVTEWEEIRSVVSTHYTCALSFPQHQIRSCMFPDQRPKKVYVGKWRTRTWSNTGFSEKSCSCSNSLISFLLVITFSYHWKINPMTIYSRSCNFLYIFFCLVKTSSYKGTVTSNYEDYLEQKNIFTWQESNPQEIFWVYQHGRHFVLYMAAVKSCENDL